MELTQDYQSKCETFSPSITLNTVKCEQIKTISFVFSLKADITLSEDYKSLEITLENEFNSSVNAICLVVPAKCWAALSSGRTSKKWKISKNAE
jgi:hypothetical protein